MFLNTYSHSSILEFSKMMTSWLRMSIGLCFYFMRQWLLRDLVNRLVTTYHQKRKLLSSLCHLFHHQILPALHSYSIKPHVCKRLSLKICTACNQDLLTLVVVNSKRKLDMKISVRYYLFKKTLFSSIDSGCWWDSRRVVKVHLPPIFSPP